jgi:hypothetical protein
MADGVELARRVGQDSNPAKCWAGLVIGQDWNLAPKRALKHR